MCVVCMFFFYCFDAVNKFIKKMKSVHLRAGSKGKRQTVKKSKGQPFPSSSSLFFLFAILQKQIITQSHCKCKRFTCHIEMNWKHTLQILDNHCASTILDSNSDMKGHLQHWHSDIQNEINMEIVDRFSFFFLFDDNRMPNELYGKHCLWSTVQGEADVKLKF